MLEVDETLCGVGGKERIVLFEGSQVSASRPSGKGLKRKRRRWLSFIACVYWKSCHTSKETCCISVIKMGLLVMFRETVSSKAE
jgi:hypothetical protein